MRCNLAPETLEQFKQETHFETVQVNVRLGYAAGEQPQAITR